MYNSIGTIDQKALENLEYPAGIWGGGGGGGGGGGNWGLWGELGSTGRGLQLWDWGNVRLS